MAFPLCFELSKMFCRKLFDTVLCPTIYFFSGKRAVVDHEKLEATKNAALKRTAAAVLQFQTTLHKRVETLKSSLNEIEQVCNFICLLEH